MSLQKLLTRLAEVEDNSEPGEMVIPSPELIGFVIHMTRKKLDWKVEALASLAGVSVSTIERVERGETVSTDAYNKIARAFGENTGFFTEPRIRQSLERTADELQERYAFVSPVAVRLLKDQSQIRRVARCDAMIIHKPSVDEKHAGQIEDLVEWFNLIALETSEYFITETKPCKRRDLYEGLLTCVANLRKAGIVMLVGVKASPQAKYPDWKVAVLSFHDKSKDPGALKRTTIMLDMRLTETSNLKWT